MITQEQLDEAVLGLMGHPDWDIIATFLVNEAVQARDMCADANSWEDVQKLSGFAEGLAFVVNLRDMTEKALENARADV